MSNQPTILLVEDDDFAAEVANEMLNADYAVTRVESGQAALDYLAGQMPDLVLLDVSMPGLSGYEVCRKLRDDSSFDGLPIIFLSGMVSEVERLAGYEAGGDDYLTKPVAVGELRHKIDLQMKNYAERRRLKGDLANTFATAITAMSSAAEIGAILHFLRTSFTCPDYTTLCHEVIQTLSNYGIESNVQIRGALGVRSYRQNGPCSPLEESVLNHMASQGRLFDFSSCLSCSYNHITIICKKLDRSDADRYGRLRDNLALLAEGADARIVAIDETSKLVDQHTAMANLISNTKIALQKIDQRNRIQHYDNNQIFKDLQKKFELRMISLGLTQSQEDEVMDLLQNASRRALALFNEDLSTQAYMAEVFKQLDSTEH